MAECRRRSLYCVIRFSMSRRGGAVGPGVGADLGFDRGEEGFGGGAVEAGPVRPVLWRISKRRSAFW